MSRSGFALAAALLLLAGAAGAQAQGSGVPNGKPQVLAPNRPAHVAPKSLLAPVQPLGGVPQTYSGTPIDVTTYHYDNLRTGWNQTETDLTPATVASSKFGLLASLTVDGNVFAQPLLVSNFIMPDRTKHDVLIIVTGHNSVYAFDAQTFAVLWQVNLGTSQSSNDVGCTDVTPEYGISSTPVILRGGPASARLYVVAATEPSHLEFETKLHELDLGTGADVVPPVVISPSATLSNGSTLTFDPQNQWNRASLAMQDGSIYIGIGSHCDNNAYSISGWLLRYDTQLALKSSFHTIETPNGYELASIWMTGFAPAIDANGFVFVVTGNGDYAGHGADDWGQSVLKIWPTGVVKDRFTEATYNALNAHDTDFGSGGVMLLPTVSGQTAPPMAVAMGKDAVLYLLNQDDLGGLRIMNKGALQALRVGEVGGGLWGGPAYYDGPSGPTVFAQINGDVLRAFQVNTGATPGLTRGVTGTSGAGYGGSIPIVSSKGATAGTGVVWLVRRSSPIEIEAYDAVALGAPIYSANIGAWSNPGQGNPFLTLAEANGRVYVAAYKVVKVFGLTE